MTERTAEDFFIATPRLRLGAKRWRVDQGPPVLGLHGWLDNANTFDRLAPLLPRLDLVSLDLPGHGKSDHRPAGTRYHYTDYLDDVMAAADALEWPRFLLLGHSMGAGIGCLAASAFPDRIAGLILIEGMGAVTGETGDVPGYLRRSVEAMKTKRQKKPVTYRNLDVLVRARRAVGKISRESAHILMSRAVQHDGGVYTWHSDQRLTWPYPQYFTNEVMLAFLRAVTAPVLLITADDGTLRKRPYFPSRCEAIEKLQIVDLSGHHHLHLDNPAPVARAINEFINQHPWNPISPEQEISYDQ